MPDIPVGALRKGPRGGMLRNGGTNKGGPGAPPSELRKRLRGVFADRVSVIEEISGGAPVQTLRVMLADIAPHVACPNCGEPLAPKDLASAVTEITVRGSASSKDRISAIDLAGKYGLGAADNKELPGDNHTTLGADERAARVAAILAAVESRQS